MKTGRSPRKASFPSSKSHQQHPLPLQTTHTRSGHPGGFSSSVQGEFPPRRHNPSNPMQHNQIAVAFSPQRICCIERIATHPNPQHCRNAEPLAPHGLLRVADFFVGAEQLADAIRPAPTYLARSPNPQRLLTISHDPIIVRSAAENRILVFINIVL